MALTQIPIELSSTPGIVDNSNATAITIDSSENVLVGTTDTATTRVTATTGGGHVFQPNDFTVLSRESSTASQPILVLNDTGVDGELLQFRKDGTTVGSIGVSSNDNLYISGNTSHAGVTFGTDVVVPTRGGVSIDDATDLGLSNKRFKDLYLSGGAYLGGTAAANLLDYYEETAWTPTQSGVTLTVTVARAIRIGNLVTLACRLTFPSNSDSTLVAISGLPFTRDTNWQSAGAVMATFADLPSGYTQLNYFIGGSTIQLYAGGDDVAWDSLRNSDLSGGSIILTVTYQTNA